MKTQDLPKCTTCGHSAQLHYVELISDGNALLSRECIFHLGKKCKCKLYTFDPGLLPDLGVDPDILKEREKSWGNAEETHARIAKIWSGILDCEVSSYQVALCMAGMKLVRAEKKIDDPDSLIDVDGYTRIAQDIAKHNIESLRNPGQKPIDYAGHTSIQGDN